MNCKSALALMLGLCLSLSACSSSAPIATATPVPTLEPAQGPSAAPVSQVGPADADYYVVDQNARKALVDGQGRVVLPAEFSSIDILCHFTYSNDTGESRVDSPFVFFAKPAVVNARSDNIDQRGFIYGPDGRKLTDERFMEAYVFDNRTIRAVTKEEESGWAWGLMDFSGKTVIPFAYNDIFIISEGYAAVKGFRYTKGDVDIYDKTGKLLRSGQALVSCDCGGYLAVTGDNGMQGVMDSYFQWVIQPEWDQVYPAEAGAFIVAKNNKKGIIDKQGMVILPASYSEIEVMGDSSKKGYTAMNTHGIYLFDTNGKKMYQSSKFVQINFFQGGVLVATDTKNLMHAMDLTGKEFLPPARFIFWNDQDKLFEYQSRDVMSFYTGDGRKLPLPAADSVQRISPDRFILSNTDGKAQYTYGMCDAGGNMIVPMEYSQLNIMYDRNMLIFATRSGKNGADVYGLMDMDGNIVIKAQFSQLRGAGGYSANLLAARLGSLHGLVDTSGKWIWYASDYDKLMD